jgi:hypothetical protein
VCSLAVLRRFSTSSRPACGGDRRKPPLGSTRASDSACEQEASKVRARQQEIRAAARAAFTSSEDKSYIDQYLQILHQNWTDTEQAYGRSTVVVLLLQVSFALIVFGDITKIDFGPIELSNVPLIQKSIPLFTAYYLYDLVNLSYRRADLKDAFFAALEAGHQNITENDLAKFLPPRSSVLLYGANSSVVQLNDRPIRNGLFKYGSLLLAYLPATLLGMFQLLAPAINIYMFGFDDIFTVAVALVSSLLYIYTLIIDSLVPGELLIGGS